MKLDNHSKQYVSENTQQGLYCYTRLPYGISLAPAIFQRATDEILQEIPHVVYHLIDRN